MLKPKRQRRKRRNSRVLRGSAARPRLSIYRSNKKIYAQLIDDQKAVTLMSASGEFPAEIGESLAKLALEKKIKTVVFDRSGYRYHGRVKALAEGARKGGLRL